MPQRDQIHDIIRRAILKDGWQITDDPFVIAYGERFLFIDLGATESGLLSAIVGASRSSERIAIEIKTFRSASLITELQQAIGQYQLYLLLLQEVDPDRILYLAISEDVYHNFFREPIGQLVIEKLPLNLIVVNLEHEEIIQWINP
ncbi:fatty-acid synthase [Limnothrix sp. PR1529]|uniref:element excision factor XisH family protein n=1 Tax=Limnothrix sp. PR1529 TaxID=1704291 RepID=UPI00081E3D30|nr:element excision factor XisH family protein [Limnothrix sp. PR1529]OCQ89542.1 fatty-acid synthase [Limnothrix sp. P13C2]PIB04497.1 fatty-acid synthase [Limnothrix sp. PR1529]